MMLRGETRLDILHEMDCALSANGVLYKREPKSFYSEMIDHLFDRRVKYKKRMQNAKKLLEVMAEIMKSDAAKELAAAEAARKESLGYGHTQR